MNHPADMKRLLVCGSRTWNDYLVIAAVLLDFPRHEWVIVHGGHWAGADAIVDKIAKNAGYCVISIGAPWKSDLKRAAGPWRNQAMLDFLGPDEYRAFRMPGKSAGTDDMIKRCERAGIPGDVIDYVPDKVTA